MNQRKILQNESDIGYAQHSGEQTGKVTTVQCRKRQIRVEPTSCRSVEFRLVCTFGAVQFVEFRGRLSKENNSVKSLENPI